MQLKLKLSVLALLMLGAVYSCAAAINTFAVARRAAPVDEPPEVAQKYTQLDSAAYILKEADGYVAVFSTRPERVLEVTNIPVSGLRAGDRALLETGIAAADRQALLELLEDFGS